MAASPEGGQDTNDGRARGQWTGQPPPDRAALLVLDLGYLSPAWLAPPFSSVTIRFAP
jgi:hypothetical protein